MGKEEPRLKCPVCGKELEVRCADSEEPFTEEVLHEGRIDGFRVLHLYFPETRDEHLVILPKGDGVHPICARQFEDDEKAWEEYMDFCFECCLDLPCDLRIWGSELCPGCDCDAALEDLDDCEEEDDWEEAEW